MYNRKQIDDIWKIVLSEDAEEIEIPEDLLKRINTEAESKKVSRNTFYDSIKNFIFPFNLNRLRIALTVMVCVLLLSTSVLTFSSNARVFAMDGINKAVTLVYKVVGYDNGEYKVEQMPMESPRWLYIDTVYYSDEFIEKDLGFPVSFPETLQNGYNLYPGGRTIYGLEGKNGEEDYFVNTVYLSDKGDCSIVLDIAGKITNDYLKAYNTKTYKVGTKEVTWGEIPRLQFPGNDPSQKPTDINLIYCLIWENNGAYYRLWRSDSNITIDEALKLAEAIIYNKCPQNEEFKFSGEKYDKDEISNEELEKQSGLRIKFPDKLDSFKIEHKTISTLTGYGESIHIVDAYYSNQNRHLKISIRSMMGDIRYLNLGYDIEPKVINIGDTQCYWFEIPGSKGVTERHNEIGWRTGEADYFMNILDGGFDSIDEATSIAKAVIESK